MRISELKGIGEKTEKLFNKLSIYSTEELIKAYPRTYDVFEEPALIPDMTENKNYAFRGVIISDCTMNERNRLKVLSVLAADEAGNKIKLTWFNMPFLKNTLKRGYRFIFRGKVSVTNLAFMEQPAIYSEIEYAEKLSSMQPIYHLTAGLTNNIFIKSVAQCIKNLSSLYPEYLPEKILSDNGLIDYPDALKKIHFPQNTEELKAARKRIVFDEFFLFSMSIRAMKEANLIENNTKIINDHEYSETILKKLPYSLTNAQQKVWEEIKGDMAGKRTMNRLIQGDVGSGKTIIAFLSMLDVCRSGYQCALMAPTEVLAKQHYDSLKQLLDLTGLTLNIIFLSGSLTQKAKREAQELIAKGIL